MKGKIDSRIALIGGGLALVAVVVLVVFLANGGKFTLVPSFLQGHEPSINLTGVYVTSGTWNTGWQNTYSIYAFQLDSATVGGQPVQLTVPTHTMGNGIYGLFQCRYHPSVYYVLTGTAMPAPDTWKIFNLNNPTTLVTVNYQYIANDAVSQDQLNNQVYAVCGGGYDLQGNPTGGPINPFSGNPVNISRNFGTEPAPVCNNDGICGTSETTANCPADCPAATTPGTTPGTTTPGTTTPAQNSNWIIYVGIAAFVLLGAGALIMTKKKSR